MKNIVKNAVSSIKNWWVYLVIGILFITVSFVVLSTPTESYVGLAGLMSVLVLISGLLTSYFSIANRKTISGWGWYLAGGIFETVAGIGLISYPEVSVAILPAFVGFWILFRATQLIANSIELRNYGVLDWGWLMLLGVSLSVLAFFMIFNPVFGFFSIISLTFISLFTAGVSYIWLSLKLRKIKVRALDLVKNIKTGFKESLHELKAEIDAAIANAESEEKSKGNTDQLEPSLSQ